MINPRKMSILIVDDDPNLREALVEQLALYEEFHAVSVETGAAAVQAAKNDHTDLVIMDVGLPDIHGRELGTPPAQKRVQGADHHADRSRY